MDEIKTALARGTAVLESVTAETISSGNLADTAAALESLGIKKILQEYPIDLPDADEEDEEKESSRLKREELADSLNRAADPFNDQLDRIKKMREDLKQDALDPVIKAAQDQIRAVYGYTAMLND